MNFSKKSRYGLRALIDLSVYSKESHVALAAIAERNSISPQYLEQVFAALRRAGAQSADGAFGLLRAQFQTLADDREAAQNTASAALEAAFDFMEQAFAESQEMVVFVTELTLSPAAHAFITENGCERYFQYNKDLLLDHRKAALQQELAAEEKRHGGI